MTALTRTWSEHGFWKYSCGCIQFQDGWESCERHRDGTRPVVEDTTHLEGTGREIAHIYLMSHHATLPAYKTSGSVGMDIAISTDATVRPGEWSRISTGLIIKPPEGYFAALYGRSSLCQRFLMLANNVGITDPDYCGPKDEIKVQLYNFGLQPVHLLKGERVAQIVFTPYVRCELELFNPSGASRGGYGSTGTV